MVAGILYLMLAIFAGATIGMLWALSPYDTSRFISEMANAWEIYAILLALSGVSFALAAYLLIRRKSPAVALFIGAALALVSVAWNVVAMALWVLPALFMWRAYAKHDA